jgi:cell division septation protein DedD
MTSKTSQTNKAKRKTQSKKKTTLSFTRKELFLWLGVAFLTMVWMFILGVIVGRGLSPVRFDVEKLQQELVTLKQEALKAKEEVAQAETEADEKHLGFYDILTEKKEMARLRSLEDHRETSQEEKEEPTTQKSPPKQSEKKVKTVSKKQDTSIATAAQSLPATPSYTLQVASFQDTARAREFVSTLESKGYDAYQVSADVEGKGVYYRVRVGHFRDKHEAAEHVARLKRDDLNPLLIRE